MLDYTKPGKPVLLAAVLASLFLLVGMSPLKAGDRDHKCEQRIHKVEARLRDAVQHHGEHSRQAEKRRDDLHRAREACHEFGDRDHDHDRH